jgi:hypothetical protein
MRHDSDDRAQQVGTQEQIRRNQDEQRLNGVVRVVLHAKQGQIPISDVQVILSTKHSSCNLGDGFARLASLIDFIPESEMSMNTVDNA